MKRSWLPRPDAQATCVITGASAGIGEAIARKLAVRGHNLTLVARREDRLHQLARTLAGQSASVDVIACDLGDPIWRERLITTVRERGRRVDVLVNSAGLGTYGRFVDLDRSAELEAVRVMSEALIDLCSAFTPQMAANKAGAVLIVASGLGFTCAPGYATYAASKAFCISFGSSLHAELRGSGVAVSTLCPGPVSSEFFTANGAQPPQRLVPGFLWRTPEQVAEEALHGLERNRACVIPGRRMRLATRLGRLTPPPLRGRAMLGVLNRAPEARASGRAA